MDITQLTEFFKNNSDTITAFSAIGALIISTIAIVNATGNNRKQILVGKIEEIYELVVLLSVEYGHLYDTYTLFEKTKSDNIPVETRKVITQNFAHSIFQSEKRIEEVDLYQMTIRLNVLANAYLLGENKFDVIGYSQLFEALINVLRFRDLKSKEESFPEYLPTTENIFKLVDQITAKLVSEINLGSNNKGYLKYRESKFKKKLGIME